MSPLLMWGTAHLLSGSPDGVNGNRNVRGRGPTVKNDPRAGSYRRERTGSGDVILRGGVFRDHANRVASRIRRARYLPPRPRSHGVHGAPGPPSRPSPSLPPDHLIATHEARDTADRGPRSMISSASRLATCRSMRSRGRVVWSSMMPPFLLVFSPNSSHRNMSIFGDSLRRLLVPSDDVAWVHFLAPDGNVYGITQGRDLESARNHVAS